MVVGRFAPTPSGRMHLGNVFAALIAWLSVRSQGGEMVLRMEDLDTLRTSDAYARLLRQDLAWLGLDYDRETPPQSTRSETYDRYFDRLMEMGLLYPCYCTRSQLHSVNAPHLSDGTYVYPGTCRNLTPQARRAMNRAPAWRVVVPDRLWSLDDRVQGRYELNLAKDCGDMVVRRADGVYVYQLAVTVDDLDMGITDIVRGRDLLRSNALQIYIRKALIAAGFQPSEPVQSAKSSQSTNTVDSADATISYAHLPLIDNAAGQRLAKRERSLDLGILTAHGATAQQIIGYCAWLLGLQGNPEHTKPQPMNAAEALGEFSWSAVRANTSDRVLDQAEFNAYFGL